MVLERTAAVLAMGAVMIWAMGFRVRKLRLMTAWPSSGRRDAPAAPLLHSSVVDEAQRLLASEEKAYKRRVDDARRTLSGLESATGRSLGGYRGVELYQRWISTPQGSGPLAGAQATVDTLTNLVIKKGPLLVRMAEGSHLIDAASALASPGPHTGEGFDTRELYLVVETTEFTGVVPCPVDEVAKACQFAARINTAAQATVAIEPSRAARIESATRALALAQSSIDSINEAKARLLAVRAEPDIDLGRDEARIGPSAGAAYALAHPRPTPA